MIRYIMDTLQEYKDFFPFGSAMLGACTGGVITFMLTRSKEKKERREKRLNSLFELQRLYYKLIRSLLDLELKVSIYISTPQEIERQNVDYSIDAINSMIPNCLDELADARVASLGHAIHISEEVFKLVNDGMEEVMFLFVPVTVQKNYTHNGQLKFLSIDNLIAIQNTHKKIADLQSILMKQEKKYVSKYIDEYINEI